MILLTWLTSALTAPIISVQSDGHAENNDFTWWRCSMLTSRIRAAARTFVKRPGGDSLWRATLALVRVRRDVDDVLRVWTQVSQSVTGRSHHLLYFRSTWKRRKEVDGIRHDWTRVDSRRVLPRHVDWRTTHHRGLDINDSRQRDIYTTWPTNHSL